MSQNYYDKWNSILNDYKDYKGSIINFCKDKGIATSSFYKALKIFKDKYDYVDNDNKVDDIKLTLIKPEIDDIATIDININGYNLSFNKDIDILSLSKIIKAMK